MFNKDVEKLFRKEKCSRNEDLINVKFLASFCSTEEYEVVEYVYQGSKTIKSTFNIVVPIVSFESKILEEILIEQISY